MTRGFRGSTATAGSFCRPRLWEQACRTSSVYGCPVTRLKSLTYPPFAPLSFVSRVLGGSGLKDAIALTTAAAISVTALAMRKCDRRRVGVNRGGVFIDFARDILKLSGVPDFPGRVVNVKNIL